MAEVNRWIMRVEARSEEQRDEIEATLLAAANSLNAGLTRTDYDWPEGADYMMQKRSKRLRRKGVLA